MIDKLFCYGFPVSAETEYGIGFIDTHHFSLLIPH
jgi:hypothetical protein